MEGKQARAREESWGSPIGAIRLRSSGEVSLARSIVGVLGGPLAGLSDGTVLVVLPVLGNGLIERVIAVGGRHQSLDGEEHLFASNVQKLAALAKICEIHQSASYLRP